MSRFYLLLCLGFFFSGSAQLIPVKESQVLQLNGPEKKTGLFDEYVQLTNSKGKAIKAPQQPFNPTYNKLYQPQDFVIRLDAYYNLDSLIYFDGAGKDSLLVYSGVPGDWDLQLALFTDHYKTWRKSSLKTHTAFLLLRFLGPQAEIGELLLYGSKSQAIESPAIQQRKLRSSISLAEFMGMNAFVDDPKERLAEVAGMVREYHNWDWHYPADLKAGGVAVEGIRFAPASAGPWDFDRYYREMKDLGIKVYPCIQGSPAWMAQEFDHKPQNLKYPADDPRAYRVHSQFVWQYAARYGARNQVPSMLNLAEGQAELSGLNLISGLETWNEPDKWWRGREGYFHPFEYAALLSADYDGHGRSMGQFMGLKQADQNLEFIMGGLAGLDTNYIEAIRLWSFYQRPQKDFPADALNFHHYSNDAGGQDDRAKKGIAPEADQLKERLEALVKYRNQNLSGLKIYLSEFGYDSNPRSIQAPPGTDSLTVLNRQADYLLRSLLLAQASGIDGAFIYMFRDVNAPNPNKYNSSGITAEKWNHHQPKPAFFKLKALKAVLGEFHFVSHQSADRGEVQIIQMQNPNDKRRAYIIWNKTDERLNFYKDLFFLAEEGVPLIIELPSDDEPLKEKPWDANIGIQVSNSPLILLFEP